MKAIITIIFLIVAINVHGQTPSSYDKVLLAKIVVLENTTAVLTKRVDTLVWSNTKMLALIHLQDEKIKELEASIVTMKNSLVPYNKMTFIYPLEATKDTTENSYIIRLIK